MRMVSGKSAYIQGRNGSVATFHKLISVLVPVNNVSHYKYLNRSV
jgi:hypothetical protein